MVRQYWICLRVLVVRAFCARHFSAVMATVYFTIGFDAVSDHMAIAMMAFRRQRVDSALETIKCVVFAVDDDLEGLFVFVPADFAACHGSPPQKSIQCSVDRRNASSRT